MDSSPASSSASSSAASPPAAPQRVAILGGGIGALTAAYELTRTPELRARYQVDLYQMGWRLGGKLASGRNQEKHDRNEEHGLHIWFGFYENSFAMLQDCYAELLKLEPNFHFQSWDQAFRKHSYTPVGEVINGRYAYWDINWPENAQTPGEGGIWLTPWGYFTEFLNLLRILLESFLDRKGLEPADAGGLRNAAPQWLMRTLLKAFDRAPGQKAGMSLTGEKGKLHKEDDARVASLHHPLHLLEAGRRLLARFAGDEERAGRESGRTAPEEEVEAVRWLLTEFRDHVWSHAMWNVQDDVDSHHVRNAIDVGIAFLLGILNPRYGILRDWDLNRIDYLDFREWLIENGGNERVVREWSVLRAYYDTPFAYQEGDVELPSWAAGSAARALIRICTQYKGAVLYQVQSGMGEALIAPIYRVLKARGVNFHFFHKVKHLGLDSAKTKVARIDLDIQAQTASGDPYNPVFSADNLLCWPSQPLWDQLADGAKLKAEGVNFESNWNAHPPVAEKSLQLGQDFDQVVLGVALGGFKVLNSEDGSLAQELIDANPRFQAMTEELAQVPTLGVQFWMKKSNSELGWQPEDPQLCKASHCRPAAPGGAEPVDVWADMSQVLEVENWPASNPPRSLHYFCGPLHTDLYRRPRSQTATPAEGYELVYGITHKWFSSYAYSLWPKALSGPNSLDWNELYGSDDVKGAARIREQYLRANIDPTETVTGSFKDKIQYRLAADQSGFENLMLAGAWTLNGMNVTCVEGAVMSGMAAARGLSGEPRRIVGEYFMQQPPSDGGDGTPVPTSLLPYHSSMLGHGQISVEPPGVFTGARAYAFGVQVDTEAITKRAQKFLGEPMGGALQVRALGSTAVVTYMNVERLTTPAQSVGWIPDREWAIWTMLAVRINGGPERVYWWMPYLIIDNMMGQIAGYEGWGYLKNLGTLNLPMEHGDPSVFTASTTLFRTLNPETKGEYASVCTIYKDGKLGWLESALDSVVDLGKWMLNIFEQGTFRDDIAVLRMFWETLTKQHVPVLNLKQFRDSVDPTRACYQALTLSPLQINKFRRAGFVSGEYRMQLAPVESHKIKDDLGLPDYNVPVTFGMFVEMDFQTTPGSILWQAPHT